MDLRGHGQWLPISLTSMWFGWGFIKSQLIGCDFYLSLMDLEGHSGNKIRDVSNR